MKNEIYIRASTAKGAVLAGGCGECKLRRSEECKGCRTQAILDLLTKIEKDCGRLIVEPETVYQHDAKRIYESKVRRVIYETDAGFAFDERAIGKTVFLTCEEAKAALKREADHAR